MSKNRFEVYATNLAANIRRLYVAALRESLQAGIRELVKNQYQDSSNLAVHWMFGVKGGARPASRSLSSLANRDLRETKAGKPHPLVGKQGEGRTKSGAGNLEVVATQVAGREGQIIDKVVKGNAPPSQFYFYNSLASDPEYSKNAKVDAAVAAAYKEIEQKFAYHIKAEHFVRHRK